MSGIGHLSKVKHSKMVAGMTLGDTLYCSLLKSQTAKKPRTQGAHLEVQLG